MTPAFAHHLPLTPTLSPEGRGGFGAGANNATGTASTSPLRGEFGPQDRVRGTKAPHSQIGRARSLRRQGTDAERLLWSRLRNRQVGGRKFVRQLPVGRYFADFACRESMLVIEVDGSQHDESGSDVERTMVLNAAGYSVLRFWNNEVLGNLNGVLAAILLVLLEDPSPGLRFAPDTLSAERLGTKGASAASAKLRHTAVPRRHVKE